MKKRERTELQGHLAVFAKQYARKAQKGVEPNDRRYDMKIEKLIKKMPPEELSQLLNEGEENEES